MGLGRRAVNARSFRFDQADGTMEAVGGWPCGDRRNTGQLLYPSCFDPLAEQAGVRYSFTGLSGTSWSDQPVGVGQ